MARTTNLSIHAVPSAHRVQTAESVRAATVLAWVSPVDEQTYS
jgi:hypothetical protein